MDRVALEGGVQVASGESVPRAGYGGDLVRWQEDSALPVDRAVRFARGDSFGPVQDEGSGEVNRPSIQDVVRAQMKEMQPETGGESGEGEGENKMETEGILFPLTAFTANLAQGDGPRRYVRLDAVLKFSKDSKEAEFKARQPQIRDVIISILNSKRPEDLLKLEGKEYLKEEIKTAINSFLIDGHVVDVYYVGFQVN